MTDISKPVWRGGLVERTTPSLHQIPRRDLEFEIQHLPKKVDVIITSKNWQIEGFGTGDIGETNGNRNLVFHSIVGYRKQGGSTETYSAEVIPGTRVNVYFMNRSRRVLLSQTEAKSDRR